MGRRSVVWSYREGRCCRWGDEDRGCRWGEKLGRGCRWGENVGVVGRQGIGVVG